MTKTKLLGVALALSIATMAGGCMIVVSDDGIDASDGFRVSDQRSHEDRRLADAVRSALREEPLLHDSDLTVSAHDGVVTLRGEVSDLAALDRAVQVSRAQSGVDKVVSKIKVEVR